MRNGFVGPALFALGIGAICCQSPPDEAKAATNKPVSSAVHEALSIPKPIPGGDFFSATSQFHPVDGIIHQYYPAVVGFGDGIWAEPNGIIDFNGFVAQVFMGGWACDDNDPGPCDARNPKFLVDVDTRVYRGEYIDTNGERAWGTFCSI